MADQSREPFAAAFSWSKPAREVTRDSYFPEGSPGAPAMPTYPTKKGLHLIRRALMHLNEPVLRPVCSRCERPLSECQAAKWGDARLILECRDAEIALLRARLAAALKVARCGVDARARLRTVDGSGAATIYFSAALAELNKLLPEADRVLVGQEQHELSLASATAVTQRQGETDG